MKGNAVLFMDGILSRVFDSVQRSRPVTLYSSICYGYATSIKEEPFWDENETDL